MAEEGHPSRYVKLTKDQDAPSEDIRPGELNQPVHVPQLEGRRCGECGQVLPESYEPPADEPWTTGIFGCTDDFYYVSTTQSDVHVRLAHEILNRTVFLLCRIGQLHG